MHIQKLEEEEAKSGPRQKELKNALKELKINPARYHGRVILIVMLFLFNLLNMLYHLDS